MLTELLVSLSGVHPSLIGAVQIALDFLILLVLLLFFFASRRQKSAANGGDELLQAFEKIIEDTRTIGNEFETNLRARQALIQQLLAGLDQRIQEARQAVDALQDVQPMRRRSPEPAQSLPNQSDCKQVVTLAKNGMDAQAIAKELQKPVGEVELILNIQRLSSTR